MGKRQVDTKIRKDQKCQEEINIIDEEQKDKHQLETRISQLEVRKLGDERRRMKVFKALVSSSIFLNFWYFFFFC